MNTRIVYTVLFSLCSLLFLSSCKKGEFQIPEYIDQQFIDLGTHKVASITTGTGQYTVLFENGLGTEMDIWVEPGIFEAIGENAQVIAYNRAGYETSEPGPEPRNMPRLISELDEVINALSQNDKVILVGHSLGGAIIRSYAVNFPEKVEALVFIEGTHEDWLTITQQDEIALVSEIYRENPNRTGTLMEARQFVEIFDYLETLPNLPDVPTVAMASTKLENGITEGYVNGWIAVNKTLGNGLSNFKLITTDKSGHQIHVDEPKLVIDAILELIY